MAQLNVEIDDDLLKRTKLAVINHNIKNLKTLVNAALEQALIDLDAGDTTKDVPAPESTGIVKGKLDSVSVKAGENIETIEIIEDAPPVEKKSKRKAIKKL